MAQNCRFIQYFKYKRTFLLEPSNEMYKKLSKYEFIKAKTCTAQDYDSDFNNKFDVITSLWNVLGHVGLLRN